MAKTIKELYEETLKTTPQPNPLLLTIGVINKLIQSDSMNFLEVYKNSFQLIDKRIVLKYHDYVFNSPFGDGFYNFNEQVHAFLLLNSYKYNTLYNSILLEYNPINNYDKTEVITRDVDEISNTHVLGARHDSSVNDIGQRTDITTQEVGEKTDTVTLNTGSRVDSSTENIGERVNSSMVVTGERIDSTTDVYGSHTDVTTSSDGDRELTRKKKPFDSDYEYTTDIEYSSQSTDNQSSVSYAGRTDTKNVNVGSQTNSQDDTIGAQKNNSELNVGEQTSTQTNVGGSQSNSVNNVIGAQSNVIKNDTGEQTNRDNMGAVHERITNTTSGNIGVMSTQNMIEQEREIALFTFYDSLIYDIVTELCTCYDVEEGCFY